MQRLFLGAFLAAVAVFFWGFVFWGTPLSSFVMTPAPEGAALAATLDAALPETGVYFLPDMPDGSDEAALEAHRAGPIATVFFRREGANPMGAGVFVGGFLHMFFSMLLLGLVLRAAAPALPTFARRAAFVFLAAVAVAVWANLGKPVWYFQPWDYHLGTAFYDIVAWTLAGLILARIAVAEAAPVPQPAAA